MNEAGYVSNWGYGAVILLLPLFWGLLIAWLFQQVERFVIRKEHHRAQKLDLPPDDSRVPIYHI